MQGIACLFTDLLIFVFHLVENSNILKGIEIIGALRLVYSLF